MMKHTNYLDSSNLTILKTELKNKSVNIMVEECAQFLDLEPNVVMMDGFSRTLIVVELVVNMILSQSLIWTGIIELLKLIDNLHIIFEKCFLKVSFHMKYNLI